jgi:hypothetical protein
VTYEPKCGLVEIRVDGQTKLIKFAMYDFDAAVKGFINIGRVAKLID